jgi:hypothetical protein
MLTNNPQEIIIQHSNPFRMRRPDHQAAFFKLLSTLFCYMVSGNSCIGYLARDEWNQYYQTKYNLHVCQVLISAAS